jgi:hypothetical protein
MFSTVLARLLACAALPLAAVAIAKPIAFQNGSTLMLEYGAGTMEEAQGFYAPRYFYSVGAGYLRLEDERQTFSREISYLRLNYLVKRWNLADAQANVFVWGGAGGATGSDFGGTEFAQNAGVQGDYETLRVYGSLKTDWQGSADYAHRIDTVQLGVAPYRHRYDGLATWLVGQARQYSGGIYDGTEAALLVRFFRGPLWLEAGVTNDGKLQSMLMFNF